MKMLGEHRLREFENRVLRGMFGPEWVAVAGSCKVRGLTLLLLVGTLWRCDDGLFFEVPPLASDALLTTLHPLLENVLLPFHGWKITEIAWGEI
jgi:hypothetical protein